jgi:hypothetical protein
MENNLLKAIGLIRRGNAIQAVDGRGVILKAKSP